MQFRLKFWVCSKICVNGSRYTTMIMPAKHSIIIYYWSSLDFSLPLSEEALGSEFWVWYELQLQQQQSDSVTATSSVYVPSTSHMIVFEKKFYAQPLQLVILILTYTGNRMLPLCNLYNVFCWRIGTSLRQIIQNVYCLTYSYNNTYKPVSSARLLPIIVIAIY